MFATCLLSAIIVGFCFLLRVLVGCVLVAGLRILVAMGNLAKLRIVDGYSP